MVAQASLHESGAAASKRDVALQAEERPDAAVLDGAGERQTRHALEGAQHVFHDLADAQAAA